MTPRARDLAPQPLRAPPKPPDIDEGRHELPHDAEGEDRPNNGQEPGSSSFSTGPVVGSDSANQGSDNRHLYALDGAFDRLSVPPLPMCHVRVTRHPAWLRAARMIYSMT